MLNEIIAQLAPAEWLKLNAQLQQKKNAVRAELKERGVLKREGVNNFDKYKYFSEAQYKMLFTELFAQTGLELKFNEIEYGLFETGSEKQGNGRMPKIEYTLMDTATGFGETTVITAEGMDKGDKAGFKAYTGSLKYYLANTFLVATGDDPEVESPEANMNTRRTRQNAPKPQEGPRTDKYIPEAYMNAERPTEGTAGGAERRATPKQVEMLAKYYTGENLAKLLEKNGLEKLEDISIKKASELIEKIMNKNKDKGEQGND